MLQAVQGSVSLAERRLEGDATDARRYLAMAGAAADRGAAIVSRLLAFARHSTLAARPVAAGPLLDGMAELLGATLGPAVTLSVEVAADTPMLMVDPAQLETVVLNLAQNASDALPEAGGTIRLIAAPAGATLATRGKAPKRFAERLVRVSVADDGAGMTDEVKARATEPFFTTKPEGRGTGLGLAMARGFAEQSGGRLEIDSAPGQGTVVTLWLPMATAADEAPPKAESEGRAGTKAVRLLLVDDDEAVRSVLAALLGEMGHSVTQAADAEAALALLDGGLMPDLLVTDLSMPGMDGIALLRKTWRRRPGLPAILLTGHLEDTDPTLEERPGTESWRCCTSQ